MSKCTYRSILPQLSFLLLSDGHIQQVDIGLIVHLRELHSCFCLHLVDKNTTRSPLADLHILQTQQTNQNKCLGIRNKFTTFSLALAQCMGAAAFQPWLIKFRSVGTNYSTLFGLTTFMVDSPIPSLFKKKNQKNQELGMDLVSPG